jgi:hypothetical protein
MKKGLAAIAVLILVVLAGVLAAQEVKGPRIEAKEVKHDFGKVVQGTTVSYVFEVRNTGSEPLVIDRVVPS